MLNLVANGPSGYNINNSLRFRASASAYLNRLPASTTNRKTATFSAWVKRGLLPSASYAPLIGVRSQGGSLGYLQTTFEFNGDTLSFFYTGATGANVLAATTSAVFRDPSAWYHIVLSLDTTQATSTNGIRIYINGIQQTLTISAYTQNTNTYFNTASCTNYIGYEEYHGVYFDGYMAEVNWIDGQALTPSSFGSTNATTGVWQPAQYTGTYGTNGFYLKFSDIAQTVSSNVGLGKDFSGNTNYWVTNNISVTSGTTYDAMTDVPTLTSATVANYATFNPLSKTSSNATFSNANLTVTHSNNLTVDTTIGVQTGKYYCELTVSTISTRIEFGVAKDLNWAVNYRSDGQKNVNGTVSAYGATWTTGDVIGIAFDIASATATFYKNNVSQGQITGITYYSDLNFITTYGSTVPVYSLNFGQRPFVYTPPTGFVRLNTYNLPTSTIVKGNTVMDATLYTGNLTGQSITNAAAFKPDLVWIKSRSAATDNKLTDSVRGTTKALISNTTGAETTDLTGLTAFNTNGFTVGASTVYNNTGATYVGWQWQAGQGSSSSNTSGSITSTVSVNATAGFSVVTWNTNATAGATIGHGLGVAPKLIITKNRVNTGGYNWVVYHESLGNTKALFLDLTNAAGTSNNYWNSTSPTSSVFSTGIGFSVSGNSYVAYCWAEIAGFSKFGSYTGNGSADGPFIYTGFRPKFVILKNSSAVGGWVILDTSRNTYNVAGNELYPNSSAAEGTGYTDADFLSNGFKLRVAADPNASSGAYIYMAFAENPFKNSLAR